MKSLYKIKKVWIFLWFLLIVGATFGVIVFNYGLDYLETFVLNIPKFEREKPEPVELDYVTVPAGHFSINKFNFSVDSFDIYKTEVTVKDYYALMGKNPTKEANDSNKPINMVTWNNCIEYCNAKSLADGLEPVYAIENKVVTADFTKNGWRLPTKTEWYWAAAGAKEPKEYEYSGSDDIEIVAWYLKNSGSATHEVGSKNSNQLGIFDMTGNVSEWCWDKWWDWAAEPKSTEEVANYKGSESEKVIKRCICGGFYGNSAGKSKITEYQDLCEPTGAFEYYGFRIVKNYVPEKNAKKNRKAKNTIKAPEETKAVIERSPLDDFVFVKGGTVVGSNDFTVETWNYSETGVFPAGRTVTLSNFYICDHEVTQYEYTVVMNKNPSSYNSTYETPGEESDNRPVENVSWYDAISFCNKLSIKEGLKPCYAVNGNTDVTKWVFKTIDNVNDLEGNVTFDIKANGYRLPTEAEWEYAARGGCNTYGTDKFMNCFAGAKKNSYKAKKNGQLDAVGWYEYNADERTHEVKMKLPNALGLYDMSGNVSELCWDWKGSISTSETVIDPCGASSGSYRLGCGGNWSYGAISCSVSSRSYHSPGERSRRSGFRLVRSAE